MSKGFTVIELLIVLAIVGIIASLGIAVSLDRYRLSLFHNDVRVVVDLLTQSRTEAMEDSHGTTHGLKIESNKVTLLPENETFIIDSTIKNSQRVEVIFTPLSGSPINPISFVLTNGISNKTISVNSQGVIED